MRKRFIATTLISTTLFAAVPGGNVAQAEDKNPFAGAYVGAELGYESYSFDDFEEFNSGGLSYGGLLGYRAAVSPHMLLGIEGFLGGDTAKEEVYLGGIGTIEVTSGTTWAINGLVGFTRNNALFFATLGYGEVDARASVPAVSEAALSEASGGIRAGLGMEFKISDRMGLRLSGHWQDFDGAYALGTSAGLIFQF
ncbi:outer membrane beta-barrel protein [Luteithermobacter gelatinilyticus]|uniref:outer membrane beta-barrel protein n=1 Tax=Luteithermobacter gelatinilyticus TaxID=2582913 RepID=UPI001105B059|nr:outer membrane beta-barrel protein [Luteithermobacter gelatinilyticus]